MATIPLGNFGQQVARPASMPQVPQGDPVGQAAQRTGEQIQGAVLDNIQRGTELQLRQVRAQQTLALAQTTNELHTVHDEVARGVLDGTVAPDKARDEFKQRSLKVLDERLGGYGPEAREIMAPHLAQITGTLDRSLGDVVVKRQQQDMAATLDQTGEAVSREAMRLGPAWGARTYSMAVDNAAPLAGINPAQAAKLKQSFAERVHATFFEQAGLAALENKSIQQLSDVRAKLMGPEGEPIDPERRNILQHKLMTWQRQLEGEAARNEDERMRTAERTFKDVQSFEFNGSMPDDAFTSGALAATKGTPWEEPTRASITRAIQGAGFGSLPLAKQDQILAAESNQPSNPERDKLLAQMRTINSTQRAAYEKNPWEAAARFQRGVQPEPVIPMTGASDVLKVAASRVGRMAQIEAAAGQPVPAFQPQEVPMVVEQLRTLPVSARAETLAQLGDMLKTPQRIEATKEQLKAADPVLGLMLIAGIDRSTAGRTAAELIGLGAQALADKAVKKDDQAVGGWRAEIANRVRGTLGNTKAESEVIDQAFHVYAAMQLDYKGQVKAPGFSGFAGTSFDDALAWVIGRPVERGGVKTFLPRGMDEGQFDTKARANLSALKGQTLYVRGQPVTAEALAYRWSDYGLRIVGNGQYIPVANNAPVTMDKAGTVPLVVQVP